MSMRIRWQRNVFIRHAGEESIVWCPRTGGCIGLRSAKRILDVVPRSAEKWREPRDLLADVRVGFQDDGIDPFDIGWELEDVLKALLAAGVLDVHGLEEGECWDLGGETIVEGSSKMKEVVSDEDSPLGAFCKRHDIPTDLHIDLTDTCTERDVHCHASQDQCDFLPYWLVEKALREFRAMNGLTVHLAGGESMRHPQFEKICRLCVELNLNFIIYSNLTRCNKERIGEFKRVDPQFINVSLYSMDAAVHDAITCLPGSWQKTMDAILGCEKAGVHIRLATPLLKANQDAFPALREFANEHRMHLISSSDIGTARLCLNAKGNYYLFDCVHEYVLGNVRENILQEIWQGEKSRRGGS